MSDPVAYLEEQRRRLREWDGDPKLERAIEEEIEFMETWGNEQQREEAE